MTLLDAKPGQAIRILAIADDQIRAQCTRFGMGEGAIVDAAERIPLGPVLVRLRSQEICLGRKLAKRILVEQVPSCDPR